MPAIEFDPRPGAELIPGYILEAPLGRGGFGEVWRARTPTGFRFALKFLPIGADLSDRELRSLEMLKNIRDGHLLSLLGAWRITGYFVLVMELADGTLMDRLKECQQEGLKGIPREELLGYFQQAARGIDFLNEPRHVLVPGGMPVGIQHGDIKPHNLLLIGSACKVGDFGLLRRLGTGSVQKTSTHTPAYTAPEVLFLRPCAQSDQYSLAVTWCQLLGARLPFEGNQWELNLAHENFPPNLSMLPEAERPVVARALSKQPEDRWPSCRAFIEALQFAPRPVPPPMPSHGGETLLTTPGSVGPTASSILGGEDSRLLLPTEPIFSGQPVGFNHHWLYQLGAVLVLALQAAMFIALLWLAGWLPYSPKLGEPDPPKDAQKK
jgi:serine/threonine-protein kinase